MNKMAKKISIIIISLLCIISICSNIVNASSGSSLVMDKFNGSISGEGVSSASKSARTILASVLTVVRTAGVSTAVIILIVIACKYIIASAGDRADIKKYAINYIIGALVLFAASGLVSLARDFVQDSFNNT